MTHSDRLRRGLPGPRESQVISVAMPPAAAHISSPERRSAADLQRILDSLIGEAGFVLSKDLPNVLLKYEQDHDTIILEASEYDSLKALCSEHTDLELGPKEMFSFLSMVPKPQKRVSPAPSLPHSSSMPPTSFQHSEQTPRTRVAGRRRHSDRIRSPSDSSSSSSEEGDDQTARFERQASAPPQQTSFPRSVTTASFAPRPLPPKRTKTLSDPSRHEASPLTARLRGSAQPPSAFGSAFARPSPASRRRRGSQGQVPEDEGADNSGSRPFTRSFSSQSVIMASPAMSAHQGSVPSSPISPTALDNTSFHARAKSPNEEEMDGIEMVISGASAYEGHHEDLEEDEVDLDVVPDNLGAMGDSLNPRLSRISTESTNSLRTSHDKLRALQKQNNELGRKLKESERQMAVIGSENERLVEDLQNRLEDARIEIAQKRKDENELKGKERASNIQIAGLEADILSLQRSLENSKTNHANMQKMYNSQCDEAARLRDMLRSRDAEIKDLEEASASHEADEEKTKREIEALEHEVKRLEEDLTVARRAESILETQKQENLQLKETIDRMRFDLDEARAASASRASGPGHQRGLTDSSGHPTLSRNLGDELNKRLMDAEKAQEQEGDEDGYVETIVTTQRTRKIGNRPQIASSSIPAIRIEDDIKEYADASTETDPVVIHPIPSDETSPAPGPSSSASSPLPPAYTETPEPINKQQVLEHAHPRGSRAGPIGHADDEYDALVDALGLRCTIIEEEIELRKASSSKASTPATSRTSPFAERRRNRQRPGIVNHIYYTSKDAIADQAGKFGVYIIAAFAIGIVAGSHLYNPSGIHPRDYQLFAQMNSLARASGAGEGLLPIGHKGVFGLVENGARLVAGRVPT